MSEENLHFPIDENDDADNIETDGTINHLPAEAKVIAREELNRQIDAFLSNGGSINHINSNVMADPPKKPENKYGSQPI